MANRLINEYSPYLQQHALNPVDWYPWGEEAFQKAQKENKPIFLSIGYSACHWCHVMERESFENETTAGILNRNFVSIKVDREERPDIDKHFQEVYQLMNGRPGGWPASIFLSQDLKPIYAATYIPDEPRYGMMSFGSLLEVIAEKYRTDKKLLIEKADEILGFINSRKEKIQATRLDESIITRFIDQARQLFDHRNGGFNKAPKFPQTSLLKLLLDLHRITGDKEALQMATHSLVSMAKGGLRDLVDGGFCRYSTDDKWLVPHFEKMTYDNALISELYLKAFHTTGEDFYKSVAFETLDFILEKMCEKELFYSASDADTEGEEGKYFVYSYEKALKSFAKAGIPEKAHQTLAKALHITQEGNFEGKNIIRVDDPVQADIPYYDEAIAALKKRREEKRLYPFIDKKILVSWNAMMIKSLFQAGRIEPRYLEQAKISLGALLESMYIHSQLFHSTLIGKEPKIHAFLEDYAYLADALIEAYRSTLDETYLITATRLANNAIERYYNNGLWKFSRGEFETSADIYDSSYPSAMAVMLNVLHSLSSLVDTVYKKFVFKTLEIHSYDIMRQPISSPLMSATVIRYLKDDVIIKATEEKLLQNTSDIDAVTYPFTYVKNDTNDGFMICNSSSCFGHEKAFDHVLEYLNRRKR
ncbi:thioredoxin domain-containing protein [Sulfurovum sp.]|uniref:thioredoxin domain-containing protein n=1 Tax=Sulfurovum sp. TaxID=1969726 RepID=UPI002A360A64|nr:thioredoxin domain-containing protein [Sulfurovum sp.]MDD2451369.1 thioredoxin domain-containing protein [Sulfurovum sp.]MDD3499241.1 thioredoxin domain-containing protein [Sulfurovum sp.]MDY0402454.1 thioredoxin domain-containing protein [Sulfurovum sp.]